MTALGFPPVWRTGSADARPEIFWPSSHGLPPLIAVLSIAQVFLADMFPRHYRPRTLGAKTHRRVSQLVGTCCRRMQLTVVRTLFALDAQCPQTKPMIAPSA